MDYRDKIAKLLALATSPNENEAKAALLKARKLMAEHKLCEDDCLQKEEKPVVKRSTDIYFTAQTNWFMANLSAAIAEAYCCASFRSHYKKGKKYYVGFIGFEEDVTVCEKMFAYAIDCIKAEQSKIRKQSAEKYATQYIAKLCNSYGDGFSNGVCEMFKRQNRENQEYGLVLVVPAEVKSKVDAMKPGRDMTQRSTDNDLLMMGLRGYDDGLEFSPSTKLPEGK